MRACALLVAVVATLAAGCGGEGVPPLPEGRFLAARQTVTPRVHLFAEPIVARIDVIVDSEHYHPDRVRVAPDFDPYEQDGDPRISRRDDGRYTQLRYEYTIRCLVYACLEEVGGGPPEIQAGGLPPSPQQQAGGFGERKTTRFNAARVLYDDPEKGEQRVRNLSWPVVQSVSRLNYGDTGVTGVGFPFEASVTPLPGATYRIAPALLGAGLLVGALALLALPAVLVVRALRREESPIEETPELSPLERALWLVEWARARPEGERREALEALAVELEAQGSELTSGARRLAWTPLPPSPEGMDEFVTAVKEADAASA